MESFISWVSKTWEENSIIFLFISALIGGLIGASIKLFFDFLIPESLKAKREAKKVFYNFRPPLIRSASALQGRIANLLQMHEYDWFKKSDYYKMSTLYVFCNYFAWIEILIGKQTYLKFESSKKNKTLTIHINYVEKSLNNKSYFGDVDFEDIPPDTDIPKFVCKALGESMIVNDPNSNSFPMGFVKFIKKVKEDENFKYWLSYLENLLTDVNDTEENFKWDRLLIIELALMALINLLDPKSEMSKLITNKKSRRVISLIKRKRVRNVFLEDCKRNKLHLLNKKRIKYYFNVKRSKKYPKKTAPQWFQKKDDD